METGDGSAPRGSLGRRVDMLVTGVETALYGIAFLLLVAASVPLVVGGVQAVILSVTHQVSTLEGGVLVLDRILLVLIIAELASTLRTVLRDHEIAAEPFLFVALIAVVRRILIVTAAVEEPKSDQEMNRLLLQLGALGLLVFAIAASVFMIRYSARRFPSRSVATTHADT